MHSLAMQAGLAQAGIGSGEDGERFGGRAREATREKGGIMGVLG